VKLRDRIAIVTGAGSGIGQGIAEAMVREKAKVVVADVSDERGQDVASKLGRIGQTLFKRVDVSSKHQIREVVDAVLKQFGRIDILVNNAGIVQTERFLEGKEADWDVMIAVNLKGVILFTQAVLGGMVERKYGKIVNIASGAGVIANGGQVVYSASKGGVIAFTRSLAAEVAPHHINVNAICPGFIETPMTTKGLELHPSYFKKIVNHIPWGRAGLPGDIAKVAAFLASDDSEYMTGQCIVVDGGAAGR